MPPKPQVFKTPDGKEFSSRAEWRDYMLATFYSFKNRVDEPNPLIKAPGSIAGQMFDIADCKNCTMTIMDQTEQVQIDDVSNCRIFIGACASSIFIRNCKDCVFYTCCRQLRLRDVTDCKFYIYSMAEVHIEFTSRVFFAPFNGGYPEHSDHLRAANLDVSRNLWYDIYDHNDPNKTHLNWALIPEAEYEEPWFPNGTPCEPAIARTPPGSAVVAQVDLQMQSFSLQKMMEDAKEQQKSSTSTPPPLPPSDNSVPPIPLVKDEKALMAEEIIRAVFTTGKLQESLHPNFILFGMNGVSQTKDEVRDQSTPKSISSILSYNFSNSEDMLAVIFLLANSAGGLERNTAVFVKDSGAYKLLHLHQSIFG